METTTSTPAAKYAHQGQGCASPAAMAQRTPKQIQDEIQATEQRLDETRRTAACCIASVLVDTGLFFIWLALCAYIFASTAQITVALTPAIVLSIMALGSIMTWLLSRLVTSLYQYICDKVFAVL